MSLLYLVKLEMLIAHVPYHWVVKERNSRNYRTLTVASIRQIWIHLTIVCGILQEKVYKTRITYLEFWTHWRCCHDDMIQLGPFCFQLLFRFVQISDACLVHLLLQYSHML